MTKSTSILSFAAAFLFASCSTTDSEWSEGETTITEAAVFVGTAIRNRTVEEIPGYFGTIDEVLFRVDYVSAGHLRVDQVVVRLVVGNSGYLTSGQVAVLLDPELQAKGSPMPWGRLEKVPCFDLLTLGQAGLIAAEENPVVINDRACFF